MLVAMTYMFVVSTVLITVFIKMLLNGSYVLKSSLCVCVLSVIVSFFILYLMTHHVDVVMNTSSLQFFTMYVSDLYWRIMYAVTLGGYFIVGFQWQYNIFLENTNNK